MLTSELVTRENAIRALETAIDEMELAQVNADAEEDKRLGFAISILEEMLACHKRAACDYLEEI